eukprot:g5377.t1
MYAPGLFGNIVSRPPGDGQPQSPEPPMTDYFVQAALDIPPSFASGHNMYGDKASAVPTLEERIEADFKARLQQLDERHSIYKSRLQDRVSNARAMKSRFDEAMQSRIARLNLAHLMYERKCRLQRTVACRRLQELLFECLGEIEKACRRSRLLAESLCTTVTSQKSRATRSTMWKEFLLRAEEDVLRRISLVNLTRRSGYKDIYDKCAAECEDALVSSQYVPEDSAVIVRRLVVVKPGATLPQMRRRNRESRRRVSRLHQSKEEMSSLIAALNHEYAGMPSTLKSKSQTEEAESITDDGTKAKRNASGPRGMSLKLRHAVVPNTKPNVEKRPPLYPAVVQLSMSAVRWLLPPQGCNVNTVVYYCLEERAMLMSKASSGSRGILSPGVVNKEGNRSLAAYARVQCSMLMYEEKVMLQQFLAAFPDVVRLTSGNETDKIVLHFAPASVLHILETSAFASILASDELSSADRQSFLEAYPNKTVLRGAGLQLYHLNKRSESLFVQCHKKPQSAPLEGAGVGLLPEPAVRELCSLYAGAWMRKQGDTTPTPLSNLLPLPNSISIFEKEMQNVDEMAGGSTGDVKQSPLHYFVLHNPTTKSVGKFLSKWNEGRRKSKLSGKKDCYGGLVEKERVAAVEYGGEDAYVGEPSNLNKNKNSSKSEISVEFLRITATSALLQELLGGKLAATIRAFCRRAAADARAQAPKNAKLKDSRADAQKLDALANARAVKENQKQCNELNRDVALSQQVFRTESEVAEELRRLCALGVFPQAELQSIRETYNELDRERVRLLSLKSKGERSALGVGAEEAEQSSAEKAKHGIKAARSQVVTRSEGDLELEFCKRKLAILRARRQELEMSLTKGAAKALEAHRNGQKNTTAPKEIPGESSGISKHNLAVREAADREVEKAAAHVAIASGSDQHSIARARLQDAQAFSRHHYSDHADGLST